jgi:hypothetical protein
MKIGSFSTNCEKTPCRLNMERVNRVTFNSYRWKGQIRADLKVYGICSQKVDRGSQGGEIGEFEHRKEVNHML